MVMPKCQRFWTLNKSLEKVSFHALDLQAYQEWFLLCRIVQAEEANSDVHGQNYAIVWWLCKQQKPFWRVSKPSIDFAT